MYRCNLNTKVWSQIMNATGEIPPATYDHAAAYYRNSFFVWGGYGSEGLGNEYEFLFLLFFVVRCLNLLFCCSLFVAAVVVVVVVVLCFFFFSFFFFFFLFFFFLLCLVFNKF